MTSQLNIFDFIEDENKIDKEYPLSDLKMKIINQETANDFISTYHYSHLSPGSAIAFGHYYKGQLVNAILYASPVGRMMAQQVIEDGDSTNVWELVRMVSFEPKPKNLESYCISKTIKYIRDNYKNIKVIVSYADNSVGHHGYVYQASNFYYYGQSRNTKEWYLDKVRVHERTLNAMFGTSSEEELRKILKNRLDVKINTKTKSRYLFIVAQNKKEKQELLKKIKVQFLPYPKGDNVYYDIFNRNNTFNNFEEEENE